MEHLMEYFPGWKLLQPPLGRGSFGVVYEIVRTLPGGAQERSALKVISFPQSAADLKPHRDNGLSDGAIAQLYREQAESFSREFRLMASMSGHNNIVNCQEHRIVPHKRDPGWDILIRMELLAPLPDYYNCNYGHGPMDEDTVIKLGIDLCRALEACEHRRIIHRDIKPQNIFIGADGSFKLGDFGVARNMEHTTMATKTGTYPFMSPEVYCVRKYNATADQYSLGLVLYWLLNERRGPFLPLPPAVPTPSAEQSALAHRMNGAPLPPPKHGSDLLKQIVLKACAYDPSHRFASATQLRMALEQLFSYHWSPRQIPIRTPSSHVDTAVPGFDPSMRPMVNDTRTEARNKRILTISVICAGALLLLLILLAIVGQCGSCSCSLPEYEHELSIGSDQEPVSLRVVESASILVYELGITKEDLRLTLEVTYDGGATMLISGGYLVSCDLTTPGEQTAVISYENLTTQVRITIMDAALQHITINTQPDRCSYYLDDTLDPTGLSVLAHYSDGSELVISEGLVCTPMELDELGTMTITVEFEGAQTTFPVTVEEPPVPQYEITAEASNDSYGTVTGAGTYEEGTTITLTATPKDGCIFDSWSDGSLRASRTITVTGDDSYTAIFYGPVSDWEESIPEDAMELDSKTQYRTMERITTTDATAPKEGFTCVDDYWKNPEHKQLEYVPRWHSGFDQSHPMYAQYDVRPVSNSETETQMVEVESSNLCGYLYWHWCRGTHEGPPINRSTSAYPGTFPAFHAYFSTLKPDYSGAFTPDGAPNPAEDSSYYHPDSDCCSDSYWYYCMEVYCQKYLVYTTHEYVYEGWGDWKDEKPDKAYESRTVYQYRPA